MVGVLGSARPSLPNIFSLCVSHQLFHKMLVKPPLCLPVSFPGLLTCSSSSAELAKSPSVRTPRKQASPVYNPLCWVILPLPCSVPSGHLWTLTEVVEVSPYSNSHFLPDTPPPIILSNKVCLSLVFIWPSHLFRAQYHWNMVTDGIKIWSWKGREESSWPESWSLGQQTEQEVHHLHAAAVSCLQVNMVCFFPLRRG